MKKIILVSFLIILSFAEYGAASSVSLHFSKSNPVAFTGETTSIDVSIVNSQSKKDTFTFNIFNPLPNEISVSTEKFLITLGPNEEEEIKLDFTPSLLATPQIVEFSVTVASTSDSNVKDTKSVFVNIKRETPVFIRDMKLDKYSLNPGETMKIETVIFNTENAISDKYFLKINVRKGKEIIKTFSETIDGVGAKSSLTVSKSFGLDKYASPGGYVVEAELRDLSNQLKYAKSLNFNVNTFTQPPTEYISKSTDYNIFFTIKTIQVKNEGNVELPSFTVTESLPKFAQSLFSPEIEPVEKSTANRAIYSWSIPSLAPGEQYTITYKLAIWRMWLSVIIIAVVVYLSYRWLSTPKVTKGVKHKGEIKRGKEILVLVEVKNKALHEIKDVEIVDIVPQIAKVIEKFDTLKPKIKKVPNGTELRWRFDSMRPREERVLTYRIKPVVDVSGYLNLPEAQMVYVDRRKIKRNVVSKQALVKAQ